MCILANDYYSFNEGDNNYYFPLFIEQKLKEWDLRTPQTLLQMWSSPIPIIQDNENERATVYALALMPDNNQNVSYEIKWDANGVPGGNHLGQRPGVAQNTFITDLSADGQSVTDKSTDLGESCFYQFHGKTVFYFIDHICQEKLKGMWWFRLKITSGDSTLAESIIEINWDEKTWSATNETKQGGGCIIA